MQGKTPDEVSDNILNFVKTIEEANTAIGKELKVDPVELHYMLSVLVWEDQEPRFIQMFESLPDTQPTYVDLVEIKGLLALLIGTMRHLRLKREGYLPMLTPEQERQVYQAAKILKEKMEGERDAGSI